MTYTIPTAHYIYCRKLLRWAEGSHLGFRNRDTGNNLHQAIANWLRRRSLGGMNRLSIFALLFSGILLFGTLPSARADSWKAGAAKSVITPENLIWMAGYGGRKAPAQGKETELFAKALVLKTDGARAVVVTLDVVGIDRKFSEDLCARLEESFRFKRREIAIAASHTHSGPVVGRNLSPLHYDRLDAQNQRLIDDYAEDLKQKIVATVGEAIGAMVPAKLQSGNGRAAFAVNRRENKPYAEVEKRRKLGTLKGPVDHDVPVLTIRNQDGNLQAILFGYACHATVLSDLQWNGDYPGYAQASLEKRYPGSVALFWAGCGGDQNPLPRKTVELAEKYGEDLARAVADVIRSPMETLEPELSASYVECRAPLAKIPTLNEIRNNESSKSVFEAARAKYLLRKFKEQGKLDEHYPYPIGHWKLGGEINFIFLGGEVVVDYALRIKREMSGPNTWVAGYANDVMAYIPSLRVLKEGGYEGGGSNVYYGLPALWDEEVEEVIVAEVLRLSNRERKPQPKPQRAAQD